MTRDYSLVHRADTRRVGTTICGIDFGDLMPDGHWTWLFDALVTCTVCQAAMRHRVETALLAGDQDDR
jgi:hypothetical protein